MRYNELMELAGVKKFQNMTASEVLEYINSIFGSNKIKLLGRGAFGAAVLIGESVYKFWLIDSAYSDYVDYCQHNPNNPFLPKFQSNIKRIPAFFIRHADAPDYVNYVKMERLYDNRNMMNTKFKLIGIEFDDEDTEDEFGYLQEVRFQDVIYYCDRIARSDDNPANSFLRLLNGERNYNHKIKELSPELVILVNTLHDIMGLDHRMDLHEGNVMMRANGQLVILDPILNLDDIQVNRLFDKFDAKLFRDDTDGKPAKQSSIKK